MAFNPMALTDSYGTVDKYFLDELAKLGYTGSVLQPNQAAMSFNSETSGGDPMSATQLSPEFMKWAEANGISTSLQKGSDQNTMQLLQNGNVAGQQTYTTKNGLDKFAEVAVPLAISIGAGGVLGQGLGLINPGVNPLDAATWGGAAPATTGGAEALSGWDAAMADLASAAPMTPEAFAAGAAGGAAIVPPPTDGGMLGKAWEFVKANPRVVGAIVGGAGGAFGGGGGGGGGSGGGYNYKGPMPTITRGAWQPKATAQMNAQPQGLLAPMPTQGQQYSGLLRYLGG